MPAPPTPAQPRSLADILRDGPRAPIPALDELALELDRLRFPGIPLFGGRVLNIPGVSDVLHLIPDAALSPATRRFLQSQRARRIRQDPTPSTARRVQEVLTAIDDIQDGAVALSVALRLAALRFNFLRRPAYAAGVAADTISIERAITLFRGLPRAGKRQVAAALQRNPRYYAGRALTATSLRTALPNAPETLQILQTSDTLLGWGISLGALMALPVSLFSAAANVAEQLDRDAHARAGLPPPARRTLLGAIAPPFLQEEAAELQDRITATAVDAAREVAQGAAAAWRVVRGWFTIQGQHQALGLRDHAFALAALYGAANYLALVAPAYQVDGQWPAVAADVPITPPMARNPYTLMALEDEGLGPLHAPRFPLPDEPATLTVAQAWDRYRNLAADATFTWREDVHDPDEAWALGQLETATVDTLYGTLVGPDEPWQTHFTPAGRALLGAMDYNVHLPDGTSPQATIAFYDQVASVLDPADRDWPGPEDYDEALRVEFSSTPPA